MCSQFYPKLMFSFSVEKDEKILFILRIFLMLSMYFLYFLKIQLLFEWKRPLLNWRMLRECLLRMIQEVYSLRISMWMYCIFISEKHFNIHWEVHSQIPMIDQSLHCRSRVTKLVECNAQHILLSLSQSACHGLISQQPYDVGPISLFVFQM